MEKEKATCELVLPGRPLLCPSQSQVSVFVCSINIYLIPWRCASAAFARFQSFRLSLRSTLSPILIAIKYYYIHRHFVWCASQFFNSASMSSLWRGTMYLIGHLLYPRRNNEEYELNGMEWMWIYRNKNKGRNWYERKVCLAVFIYIRWLGFPLVCQRPYLVKPDLDSFERKHEKWFILKCY